MLITPPFPEYTLPRPSTERGNTMTYEKEIPDYALIPAKGTEASVITPITQGAIFSPVQVTNIKELPKTTITIEEDILVPDTKPDLREILIIDGKCHLSGSHIQSLPKDEDFINLSGELELQTLYIPDKKDAQSPVIPIQSRISFKEQWHKQVPAGASLKICCTIDNIDYMVVNERKYRVKIQLLIQARQFTDSKIDFFEGLAGDDLQLLKETVNISSIALQKKDSLNIKEDFSPSSGFVPQSVLSQNISVVENYKQITADKVVINGFIYVNLLYSARPGEGEECPQLLQHQERVEFTQFIPLQQTGRQSGFSVTFDDWDLKVKLTQNEEGQDVFRLEGDLITTVELYKNTEMEVVVDAYHQEKDFICDFNVENCKTVLGTCAGESSLRELISIENSAHSAEKILYQSARILSSESKLEQNKIVTEGNICINMICLADDDDQSIFSVSEVLPYRVTASTSGLLGDEEITGGAYLKDLWAEKINPKQLEINVCVLFAGEIIRQTPFKLLTNPAFGADCPEKHHFSMVIYICSGEESMWEIAKRFKTTVNTIKEINELETEDLCAGKKLLIIK